MNQPDISISKNHQEYGGNVFEICHCLTFDEFLNVRIKFCFVLFFFSEKYTSCDFENGLCEWSQGTNDDFDWTRLSGATATIESGPSRDHSKGTGSGNKNTMLIDFSACYFKKFFFQGW